MTPSKARHAAATRSANIRGAKDMSAINAMNMRLPMIVTASSMGSKTALAVFFTNGLTQPRRGTSVWSVILFLVGGVMSASLPSGLRFPVPANVFMTPR